MARVKTINSRVGMADSRVKAVNRFGLGRSRYAPGRDSRRERVYRRDKGLCQLCKEAGEINGLDLHSKDVNRVAYCDHYISLAQGGDDKESNQWILCKACHDAKSIDDSRGVIQDPRVFAEVIPCLT